MAIDSGSGASDELIPKELHFNFTNPQLTTREAVKGEKIVAKNTGTTPDSKGYVKQTKAEPNVPTANNPKVLHCGNCGYEISKDEKAYVYNGQIVCSKCYLKLKQQP